MSALCKIRPAAAAANLREQAELKQSMRMHHDAKAASKTTAHSRWLRMPSRSTLVLMAMLLVAGVYLCREVYSYLQSFGGDMLYYWVVPLWTRRLIEKIPEVMTPVRHTGTSDEPPVEGARKVGPFWVSTLATSPNITLVHNFMTDVECEEIVRLGEILRLEQIKIMKASETSSIALSNDSGFFDSIIDYVYSLVRTSTGMFIDDEEVKELNETDAEDRFFNLLYRAELLTSLPMGNFELPFLQLYDTGQQFRAHVRTHTGAPKRRFLSARSSSLVDSGRAELCTAHSHTEIIRSTDTDSGVQCNF